MKQSLQLKLGQNLALTPQLQQAIKLLQLSTLDLQQAIDEALEGNPLLEREDEHSDGETDALSDTDGLDFTEAKENSSGDDMSLPLIRVGRTFFPHQHRPETLMTKIASLRGMSHPNRFKTSSAGS